MKIKNLSADDRIKLYQEVYKDFFERCLHVRNTYDGVSVVFLSEKTGISSDLIIYDISRIRKLKKIEGLHKQGKNDKVDFFIREYKNLNIKILNFILAGNKEFIQDFLNLSKKFQQELQSLLDLYLKLGEDE